MCAKDLVISYFVKGCWTATPLESTSADTLPCICRKCCFCTLSFYLFLNLKKIISITVTIPIKNCIISEKECFFLLSKYPFYNVIFRLIWLQWITYLAVFLCRPVLSTILFSLSCGYSLLLFIKSSRNENSRKCSFLLMKGKFIHLVTPSLYQVEGKVLLKNQMKKNSYTENIPNFKIAVV